MLSVASIVSVLANATVQDNTKRNPACCKDLGHNFVQLTVAALILFLCLS